jgi:hypothetical protein
VVSDFGLIEAIEAGIVKIPRVPVDDDAVSVDVKYLDLWPNVGPELPKRGRKDGPASADHLPDLLVGALDSLYGSYEKSFRRWEGSAAKEGEPPQVFIVVCNNTTVSKMVYNHIAGWEKPTGTGRGTVLVPAGCRCSPTCARNCASPQSRLSLATSVSTERHCRRRCTPSSRSSCMTRPASPSMAAST